MKYNLFIFILFVLILASCTTFNIYLFNNSQKVINTFADKININMQEANKINLKMTLGYGIQNDTNQTCLKDCVEMLGNYSNKMYISMMALDNGHFICGYNSINKSDIK